MLMRLNDNITNAAVHRIIMVSKSTATVPKISFSTQTFKNTK